MLSRIIFGFLFFIVFNSQGQTEPLEGKVQIIQDNKISEIVEKRISYYEKTKTIPGFRVQIFFESGNNARNKANALKSNFMGKYPGIEAYLSFQQPYFKVRVGDFRTRFEAEKFAKQIEPDYQGCFIVKDDIELPKLY